MENKILAPLYQADFRVYEGIRNAMSSGLEELKRQKGFLENQYPSLKARQEGGGETKTIVRQGTVQSGPNQGKRVIEYSDGTKEYK
jgi:hypothetical protein